MRILLLPLTSIKIILLKLALVYLDTAAHTLVRAERGDAGSVHQHCRFLLPEPVSIAYTVMYLCYSINPLTSNKRTAHCIKNKQLIVSSWTFNDGESIGTKMYSKQDIVYFTK